MQTALLGDFRRARESCEFTDNKRYKLIQVKEVALIFVKSVKMTALRQSWSCRSYLLHQGNPAQVKLCGVDFARRLRGGRTEVAVG